MKITRILSLLSTIILSISSLSAQTFTISLKSGEKISYSVNDVDSISFNDEAEEPVVAPKIGDYYYSDGTWSTNLSSTKTPIGIVFRVGVATDSRDNAAYYTCKDGKTRLSEFHGYVISLNDATTIDGVEEPVWWSPFNNDAGAGCSNDITDFLGYTNTLAIVSVADKDGGLTSSNFPAAYYAKVKYEEVCPAPEASSGWFLPSAGQFKYIYDRAYFDDDNSGRACVLNSLSRLPEGSYQLLYRSGAEFWSSTEKVDSYGDSTWAYYFSFDSSMIKPGFISDYRKNSNFLVRPILVF